MMKSCIHANNSNYETGTEYACIYIRLGHCSRPQLLSEIYIEGYGSPEIL
jgi:hypothetical protein